MQQLSGFDNYMLTSEVGGVFNHICALGIYDQDSAPDGKVRFKSIMNHISSRLTTHPLFHRRAITPPMGIDNAYWVDVAREDVDIEFHVRHVALPQPGDWRQLMIQVARLHSRPLDRSRPLWEIHVIEGLRDIPQLPKNAFAMLYKFHHASIDGMRAGKLLFNLHSATAEVAPDTDAASAKLPAAPAPAQSTTTTFIDSFSPALATLMPWRGKQSAGTPSDIEMLMRSGMGLIGRTTQLSQMYFSSLQRFMQASSKAMTPAAGDAGSATDKASGVMEQLKGLSTLGNGNQVMEKIRGMLPSMKKAPHTRFNEEVSANRVVDAVGFSFADIKTMRAHVPGITMNDIFLSVVGGAVRQYLLAKKELPAEASIIGLMPLNLQEGNAVQEGNHVGGVPVSLHTEISDPLQRLLAVNQAVAQAKKQNELMGADILMNIANVFPPYVIDQVMRRMVLPQVNTTVSNVRGPDQPFYLSGATLAHFYPVSIPTDGVGLNNTGFSYNGMFWISAVSCRRMMPDPDFYVQCLRESFAETLAACVQASPQGIQAHTAEPEKVAQVKAPASKATLSQKVNVSRAKKAAPQAAKPAAAVKAKATKRKAAAPKAVIENKSEMAG